MMSTFGAGVVVAVCGDALSASGVARAKCTAPVCVGVLPVDVARGGVGASCVTCVCSAALAAMRGDVGAAGAVARGGAELLNDVELLVICLVLCGGTLAAGTPPIDFLRYLKEP